MRQFRTYGSVRGVSGNRHPYRDPGYRLSSGDVLSRYFFGIPRLTIPGLFLASRSSASRIVD